MKGNKKFKAVLLSIILTLIPVSPVQATVRDVPDRGSDGISLSEVISGTSAELEKMTPGEDYDTDSAVIITDSPEEAEKAAEYYDAELVAYNYGVATLALKKDIREVLKETEASLSSVGEGSGYILYPQTRMRLYGGRKRSAPSTSDPKIGDQWFHGKLNTGDAWKTARGKGVLVVVIDSGVRGTHNDLKANISGNETIVTGSSKRSRRGRPGEGGWYPGSGGGNNNGGGSNNGSGSTGNQTNNDMEDGHGTHVSGLVAADEDNGYCGAGVAPDAGLYMIKVCAEGQGEDEEECSFGDVVSAINRAVELNANVINLSLGAVEGDITTSEIQAMQNAITNAYNAGITVVAAAGNDGSSEKDYPGCLDHVVNVGAIKNDNTLSDFSNYGQYVDLCAPGEGIVSTVTKDDNAMESMDGTSMSSPIVAGVAALVYSANPILLNGHDAATADKVINVLLSSTDEKEYKYQSHIVNGCIDAAIAVEKSAKGDFSGPGDVSGNGLVFREKNTGFLTSTGKNATNPIASGKSLKLQVCHDDGTIAEEAKSKKNVKWSLSNSADFSIKNGKLKCNKGAAAGADTYVYAEFAGKKVSARFVAVKETVAVGYYDDRKGKFKSKISLDSGFSTGKAISVNNCSVLASTEVLAYYTKPSKTSGSGYYDSYGGYDDYWGGGSGGGSGGNGGYDDYWGGNGGYGSGDGYGGYDPYDGYGGGHGGWWWSYGGESGSSDTGYIYAIDAGYAIKVSNSKNLGSVVYDRNGNIVSFVPMKRGTYTVTYSMIDGGSKKFKVKIKVS